MLVLGERIILLKGDLKAPILGESTTLGDFLFLLISTSVSAFKSMIVAELGAPCLDGERTVLFIGDLETPILGERSVLLKGDLKAFILGESTTLGDFLFLLISTTTLQE